jgi:ubiquinone/menaquinone biosynthesis C-methylase UbiE
MDIFPTTPREGYDRWAASYDGYDNPLITLEEPVVSELIGPVDGQQVADIGCGTGRHAERLAASGARVTGVDFSSGMLGVLRGKGAQGVVEVIEHDLDGEEALPLPSGAFDLVLCCLVIEHIREIDRIVADLARICKVGGHVIITDLHPELVRRGFHARFHETDDGPKYQISGAYHPISSYVMAALGAGLRIEHMSEHIMDEETARRSVSARKWIGLPMLLAFKLAR